MNKITEKEIKQLTVECLKKIKSDHLYQVRNDAKLRAVNNTKCYEEFKLVRRKNLNNFLLIFLYNFPETSLTLLT